MVMNSDSDHLLHQEYHCLWPRCLGQYHHRLQHNHHCHPLKPFLYLSCMDFDSLVLHDMHKRKCMVIALNYTHTSENRSQWSSGSMPDCSARGPGIESRCGQLCLSHIHCDLQHWARAVCTFPAVPRSTQPSTLRGTVNEYQLSG